MGNVHLILQDMAFLGDRELRPTKTLLGVLGKLFGELEIVNVELSLGACRQQALQGKAWPCPPVCIECNTVSLYSWLGQLGSMAI